MPWTPIDALARRPIVRAGLLGLAYLGGAELGHLLSDRSEGTAFATCWPPAGLLLAALVLTRYRAWPGLLLAAGAGNLVSNLLHGQSALVSVGLTLANAAEASLGAGLLRRFGGGVPPLVRMRSVLALAGWSALAGTAVGAAIGAAVVTAGGGGPFGTVWLLGWVAHAIGVLVVAPVILSLVARRDTRSVPPGRPAEGLVLFVGLVLSVLAVYAEFLPSQLSVPAFVLPFLLWAALRFGPPGAAVAVLVAAAIGVGNVSHGRGPYSGLGLAPGEQLVRAQAALGVISLSVLVLAAAAAERREAERQRTRLIGQLRRALTEIKALRGLIPVCAWCKKVRDDQGFWQRLEVYLRAHTDAEVTHGVCPECLDDQVAAMDRADSTTDDPEPAVR